MNGFINVLKPTGMTSHDVVKVLRRILGEKKTGHTGTLDPMAVGVLPVGIGSATKVTEYLDGDFKAYRCELKLGITTDTGDIWGENISQNPVSEVDESRVYSFENEYRGEILQKPPMYSAVRVGGKRLYEYARSGEEVEVKSRKITIRNLKIVSIKGDRILFDVVCSKGTYIRTICTEMGEKLGTGAAMTFLARTGSGAFNIQEAVTFEELQARADSGLGFDDMILPVDFPLRDFPKASLQEKQAQIFVNGGHIKLYKVTFEDCDRAAKEDGSPQYYRVYKGSDFIAMGYINEETKRLVPHKVFFREF